jgi:RNA polymerase sigma-70 factor (TIGR02957 family)
MDSADTLAAKHDELRSTAFAIAYRMLGSVSDAEDIVQESLMRLHEVLAQPEAVSSPRAYLATVVTRLCIDQLRSARVRRERYVGEWLPEPLVGADRSSAGDRVELAESLNMAFLVLLESLSAEQRAVFLLRDVFDYDYPTIARIVGKSEAACRQLVVRARARVFERRPRFEADATQLGVLTERFFDAIETGNLANLEALLAEDVSLHGDGGGKVPALARPLAGRSVVARALINWARVGQRVGGYQVQRVPVNAQAGAVIVSAEDKIIAVWTLDIVDEKITAIRSIVNPDKLRHLGNNGDFGEWLTSRRQPLPSHRAPSHRPSG